MFVLKRRAVLYEFRFLYKNRCRGYVGLFFGYFCGYVFVVVFFTFYCHVFFSEEFALVFAIKSQYEKFKGHS